MSSFRKEIEFELNLIPFIDMLSACLSFLLLTAVWSYIGSIDTQQAIGAESTNGANNPPSIVVQIDKDNSFQFDLKDVKTKNRQFKITSVRGEPNWDKIDSFLSSIRKNIPNLNTSVVISRPGVTYGLTMKTVDSLRRAEINNVGISPI
ncbi:biopolymer transporter ExbD [bacterium]|nr:biopolymer transporter ExbD [bacterium]